MSDGVPRLHGKSLAQWGDFLNEEDKYVRKSGSGARNSREDDDLDADSLKASFERRHGSDKPAAPAKEDEKEDAPPKASFMDTINSFFTASQEQTAMDQAESGSSSNSNSNSDLMQTQVQSSQATGRLNAQSILDAYNGMKFDIKNKVEESEMGSDSGSSIHLPMNRPRVVAKRALDKVVLFATSEGVGTYQGGVQITSDWSDVPFSAEADAAPMAASSVMSSDEHIEGDSNNDGIKVSTSDLFASIKKVAASNEKQNQGHVDFSAERARAAPAMPTRLAGEPPKPASHLTDEDLAVDSIMYDSNQQQEQTQSAELTHDQSIDKLAAVVRAAKASKAAAAKKREEAEHPQAQNQKKAASEDDPNPYLQGLGSDWDQMARKAKKDVKVKTQTLASNSYLSAMGDDWKKMANEASMYPITKKSPVYNQMQASPSMQPAPVSRGVSAMPSVPSITPPQDPALTSAQASLQQAQSKLAKTQMHALTEAEAMAEINAENAKEKAHTVAQGGAVPATFGNDGLQDLAAEDPTSYGLVEALMKKQQLGLIKTKAPAESNSGAQAFQSMMGGGSGVVSSHGSGGSHNWLSWHPSDDDAMVSNVLQQVADLRGGSGMGAGSALGGLISTGHSEASSDLPAGDSIKALPDDGLPDLNPFAANGAGSPMSLSTLSTSATVTQHSQGSSSSSEDDVFAAGAAATSGFQASDSIASDSSAATGNWDFLLKSKDKLRTPEKWSAQDDASKSTAGASSMESGSKSNALNANYFSATDLLVPGSDADTFSGKKSLVEKANNMASRVSDDQSSAVLNALGAASSAFSAIPSPPLPREEAPLKLPYGNADMPKEDAPAPSAPTMNLAATGSVMSEADSQLGDLKQADPSSFALVKQLLAKNAAGQLPEMHKDSSEETAQIEELLGGSGHGGAVAAAHAAGGKNWLNWKPSMVDF